METVVEQAETIAARIVRIRTALKLRQIDLADALGVSVETVSRWERGANVRRVYLDRLDDMLTARERDAE